VVDCYEHGNESIIFDNYQTAKLDLVVSKAND
jgi:hypothetical protein